MLEGKVRFAFRILKLKSSSTNKSTDGKNYFKSKVEILPLENISLEN